jgi:hypothetical protein
MLVLASLAVGWPLLLPWTYDTRDGLDAYYDAAQFDRALSDGQHPVRWLPDLFGGRGEPVFVYLEPLFFYVVAAVHAVGLGTIASTKIVLFLTLPLSGWALLRWLEEHVPRPVAAVGAVAYVTAPVHVVAMHVQGNPRAAAAYVFAPLVLLALRRRSIPGIALAFAALVLSHAVTALLLLPAFALYALCGLVPPRNARTFARLLAGVLLGALVSVWSWGPAFAERGMIYHDPVRDLVASAARVPAWGEFFSPSWSYRGSFQIGPAHVAAIALAFWAWRRARGNARGFITWGLAVTAIALVATLIVGRPTLLMPTALAAAALAAGVTATSSARVMLVAAAALPPVLTAVWALTETSLLYGAIAAFQVVAGASAIAGGTLDRRVERRGPPAIAALFVVLALPWSAVPLHAALEGEPAVLPLHERDLQPARVRLGVRRTSPHDDYLPRAVSRDEIPTRDPSQAYVAPEGATAAPDTEMRSGDLRLSRLNRTANDLSFDVDSDDGGILALNLHDFPGWDATLAGPPGWDPEPLAHGSDRAGRMVLSIPPGRFRVAVRWAETTFRRRCDLTSAIAFLLALALLAPLAADRRRVS